MVSNQPARRLAVLIDAENISFRTAPRLFEEISNIGTPGLCWAFGDFSGNKLPGWREVACSHAIAIQQVFANKQGKNATDIALVIDAMDLLRSGCFDGFCVVSSDGDFTGLANRIRKQGVDVFGFGETKTPQSFRKACSAFVTIGDPASPAPEICEATVRIRAAMAKPIASHGWARLSTIGKVLGSDFAKSFGHRSLSQLVVALDGFDIRNAQTPTAEIRVKPSQGR